LFEGVDKTAVNEESGQRVIGKLVPENTYQNYSSGTSLIAFADLFNGNGVSLISFGSGMMYQKLVSETKKAANHDSWISGALEIRMDVHKQSPLLETEAAS